MFAELNITSNFTFLRGASHPEEFARTAAAAGVAAIAVADANSVAGIVRAHCELREIARENKDTGGLVPRLLPAATLITQDGLSAIALPRHGAAWSRLSRLVTIGRRRAAKGECRIMFEDILHWLDETELVLRYPGRPVLENRAGMTYRPDPVPGRSPGAGDAPQGWLRMASRLAERFPGAVSLLASPRYDGCDRQRFAHLRACADDLGLPLVASASPIMHISERAPLADVLTAIRCGLRVDQLGRRALVNAEHRLRSEAEMLRLFRGCEAAVEESWAIAERCRFSLDDLRYAYPAETIGGESSQERLERLSGAGLAHRYPAGIPDKVRKMMMHELALIGKLGYAPYFLTVNDIVAFAHRRGILCQGRGSAANSVVCYALGVTSVSPEQGSMLFERFVSEARNEPPDIDVDFEHERREEVIRHIYDHYGRHRAGLCATVIHYRGKSAIREVGRAMGLSEDTTAVLSSQIWGWGANGITEERLREVGLDPSDGRLNRTLELCREIRGFPRHLSQHVGGFVITAGRLDELVPIENAAMDNRTVICWDKDDISALGILKVDILGLGMLTCIRKSFDLIRTHHGRAFSIATLPPEDPAVYDMLCAADSLGLFQVESRAQMNFLPRMRPRCFYDLVIEVAIIRPGPIQGKMVHPYIRRRNGEEKPDHVDGPLGEVLGKTLGVPLFQEQAMKIAIVGAGFSPEEADRLRRALATFRRTGSIHLFEHRFVDGMIANGYKRSFAERCFSQIKGFGSYGFPESHAASFALLVYASAWLKRHHPAIFACALLNSQPMGFYAPAQIVQDARRHGVDIRAVCINNSQWDNGIEPTDSGEPALRLGFRQIKGVDKGEVDRVVSARGNGYREVQDVWRRAGTPPRLLQKLAEADVFASLGLGRRQALWEAAAINHAAPLPLFAQGAAGDSPSEGTVDLPRMSTGEHVVQDYASMRLTLRDHPVALLRHLLTPGAPPHPDAPLGTADDILRIR